MFDISMLLSSLDAAKTLAGALLDERDRQKAATIKIDLTEKILHAQTQLSEVLGAVISKDAAISTLSQRVRELEAAQGEKARYQLAKLGVVGDFFAYGLRPAAELSERADEPHHFLCQPCFDAGKKGVLLVTEYVAVCPLCKNNIPVKLRPSKPSVTRRSSSWVRDW